MRNDYAQMEVDQQQRYDGLNDKYQDLLKLYDNRPSKEEDVEMINMLRQSLMLKEEELKKANENLKWFKLEIVNREGNYNKLFNANPNVGVLNPLDSKVE